MKFNLIEQHAATYPICFMYRVLGVSASGYYGWRTRPPSPRTMTNLALLDNVRRLEARHQGRYGSTRMHAALRAEGHRCSRGRVERLMRRHNIRMLAGRRFDPARLTVATTCRSPRTCSRSILWHLHRTGSGLPISPTSPPAKAGFIWPLSSIWQHAKSSVGPCATTCAPSCHWRP